MIKDLYSHNRRDRRRVSVGKRSFELKNLWEKNHEILNLASLGYSAEAVAETLGVTKATVSNTVNCPLGREKLQTLRAIRDKGVVDIAKEVAERVPRCLDVVDDILDNANYNTKMRAVELVLLELGGYAAPKKIEGKFSHGIFTPQDLLEIRKRSLEAAEAAGLVERASASEASEGNGSGSS